MIRNLKVLGLALVALLATSALASTASAQFESEAESTNLTVSSNAMQKFAPTAGGANVECTTIKVTGTQTGKAAESVTVTPTYSNCETFLGAATSVNTNGCTYQFTLPKGATTGTVHVICSGGKEIEIKVGSICTYKLGSQTPTGHVVYKNTGSGTTREVIIEPNLTGIVSTRTTNDFFCPAGGSTGTYTGSSTTTGETAGGTHVGIFVD